jgi:hypothetical protein
MANGNGVNACERERLYMKPRSQRYWEPTTLLRVFFK